MRVYKPLNPTAPNKIAPTAAAPNSPPVVFPICPIATPKAILPISTTSAAMPAQIALRISLLPVNICQQSTR